MLPEEVEGLQRLLALHEAPPSPRSPVRLDDMPVSVHFFLLPEQVKRLNHCLRKIGGSREEALMGLVDRVDENVS